MYYPYLRGKQEEILALREISDLIGQSSVVPIVEPVKSSDSAIKRLGDVAETVIINGGQFIIISNPKVGELASNNQRLLDMLNSRFASNSDLIVGVIVERTTQPQIIQNLISSYGKNRIAVIHIEESQSPNIVNICDVGINIFLSEKVSSSYIASFQTSKVILKDGFERLKNADYAPDDYFDDVHLTYLSDGFQGFGDFQMVGASFQEGGGAAYAVALHLSYFESPQTDNLRLKHFKSSSNSSPQNPGGKFGEAISALIRYYNSPQNMLESTRGMAAYEHLHSTGHYAGLGRPKRLSIMHHIEIMVNRFPQI